jgi:hypothetical protein
VAFQFLPQTITSWAVCEWDMIVCDVVEEVDLLSFEHQGSGNRVDRRIPPALIEESAVKVERVKEVEVGFGAQPVQVANFEIGPLQVVRRCKNQGMVCSQSGNGCRSCHRHR